MNRIKIFIDYAIYILIGLPLPIGYAALINSLMGLDKIHGKNIISILNFGIISKNCTWLMYYYFFAQIRIEDGKAYQQYLDKAGHVFSKFNGKYLAVDNSSQVLEGSWDYTRAVLIRFNSKKDFEQWYYSAGYQEILKHRLEASHCDTILVKGME